MKTSKVVVDLGFGDSGKGITTDFLVNDNIAPIVIRFNGGHQAGHTVVTPEGHRHIFSSFGSGTLSGAPTYWSKNCCFYPLAFLNEYDALIEQIIPEIYVDSLCPVVTPYDVLYNKALERNRNPHGSCGVGFGATMERHETSPYLLFVHDFEFPKIVRLKLNAIRNYYMGKARKISVAFMNSFIEQPLNELSEESDEFFIRSVQDCLEYIEIVYEVNFFKKSDYKTYIFEGAQGILLDREYGFFPNVTRSHTTSKNAIELIQRTNLPIPEIYYISRCYQTRHGAGWMSNENLPLNIIENPNETNKTHEFQGVFRKTILDENLLQYAIGCDQNYSIDLNKHLVMTCMDQLNGILNTTTDGKIIQTDVKDIANRIFPFGFKSIFTSYSDRSENIKQLNSRLVESNI